MSLEEFLQELELATTRREVDQLTAAVDWSRVSSEDRFTTTWALGGRIAEIESPGALERAAGSTRRVVRVLRSDSLDPGA